MLTAESGNLAPATERLGLFDAGAPVKILLALASSMFDLTQTLDFEV